MDKPPNKQDTRDRGKPYFHVDMNRYLGPTAGPRTLLISRIASVAVVAYLIIRSGVFQTSQLGYLLFLAPIWFPNQITRFCSEALVWTRLRGGEMPPLFLLIVAWILLLSAFWAPPFVQLMT